MAILPDKAVLFILFLVKKRLHSELYSLHNYITGQPIFSTVDPAHLELPIVRVRNTHVN